MRHQNVSIDLDVYAGNRVRLYAEAFAPTGSSTVNPSTARVAVTDINGVTTPLTETVTYGGTTSVRVESFWIIPDDQRGGVYTVTFDIAGNMVGAAERRIKVRQRTEPNVPV